MRIVILSSSVYSETACAMAVRLAESGHVPGGALALRALDSTTLLRKVGQWGARGVAHYARAKLIPHHADGPPQVKNPHLRPLLENGRGVLLSLRAVTELYCFPVASCADQNGSDSIALLKEWSPDLIIFTGGNILRKPLLDVPRLGVLNVHLGLLPEVRGMSSPEWSLLQNLPVGVTIHYIDSGIDTGPILRKYELPNAAACPSLNDLRNRLIAFGIEKTGEVVAALERGTISPEPQSHFSDSQFFVMHSWLWQQAEQRLAGSRNG